MVSSRQKRVWRLVAERRARRLKRYLRRHPELDVNFRRKRRRWSPLHLACSLGDRDTLLLLLRRGAHVLQEDASGDTPLHVAARTAKGHIGPTGFEEFFVLLRRTHPEAMAALNRDGVSPEELLHGRTCTRPGGSGGPRTGGREKEWAEKLLDEGADEFCEAFGAYDDVEEPFGDWADRVREEYFHKKHTEAQRHAAASSSEQRKREREEAERSRKELQRRLQQEHEDYLKRAARKQEETLRSKKRSYDQRCAATFLCGSSSDRTKLTYDDIPWPAPHATVQKMMSVILHGVDRKDVPAFRKTLRKQQALWHPDKFSQRCEAQLEEKDRQRILDTVQALSRELNSLAQSLKT